MKPYLLLTHAVIIGYYIAFLAGRFRPVASGFEIFISLLFITANLWSAYRICRHPF